MTKSRALLAHRRSALWLGAVVVFIAVGVGVASASTNAAAKPVLNIGLVQAPRSLNPALDTFGSQHTMIPLYYAPLIHLENDGTFSPGLAVSWKYVGRGNKVFEFTLRKNARFSDGTKVTARAVKTWFEYFPKGNGTLVSTMGPIRKIETLGQWTVRIHLATPNPIIPWALSELDTWGFVPSPKAVAQPDVLAKQTFGAGPYVLVPSESVANDHYTLVPNKFYYDKAAVRYSKIVVRIITNPSSMLQAMQAGQLDIAYGDPSTVDAAERAGFSIAHAPTSFNTFFILDRNGSRVKALGDVRVRQALNYAIDRKAITQAFNGKFGKPTSAFLTPDGYDPKLESFYSYNPAKAKSLLAAAGYPNGFSFNVILSSGSSTLQLPVAQAVAKYLEAVGVKLEVTQAASGGEYVQKLLGGAFTAGQVASSGAQPMWLGYASIFKPTAFLNPFKVSDPVLNRLFLKAQRAPASKATGLFKQMTRRIVTQAMLLPTFTVDNTYYISKKATGVKVSLYRTFPIATEFAPR